MVSPTQQTFRRRQTRDQRLAHKRKRQRVIAGTPSFPLDPPGAEPAEKTGSVAAGAAGNVAAGKAKAAVATKKNG